MHISFILFPPTWTCNVCLSQNRTLIMLISPRRRDFSMQTFVRPACALFFFTHCWSSDGCSNAPYAPAVQWPPPAKHWPICYGLTVQRPDTTAHCQSGILTQPRYTSLFYKNYKNRSTWWYKRPLPLFSAVTRQSSCLSAVSFNLIMHVVLSYLY